MMAASRFGSRADQTQLRLLKVATMLEQAVAELNRVIVEVKTEQTGERAKEQDGH